MFPYPLYWFPVSDVGVDECFEVHIEHLVEVRIAVERLELRHRIAKDGDKLGCGGPEHLLHLPPVPHGVQREHVVALLLLHHLGPGHAVQPAAVERSVALARNINILTLSIADTVLHAKYGYCQAALDRLYWLPGGPRWEPVAYMAKLQLEFLPYRMRMFCTVLEAVLWVFRNPILVTGLLRRLVFQRAGSRSRRSRRRAEPSSRIPRNLGVEIFILWHTAFSTALWANRRYQSI